MRKIRKIRKTLIIIVLLSLILLSICGIIGPNKAFSALFEANSKYIKYSLPDGLNIIAIDLGGPDIKNRKNGSYGDATLIEQNGNYLLIDTGDRKLDDNGKEIDNNVLIKFLKAQNVKKLSVFISHYHIDHYGKLEALLKDSYFTIDKVYLPDPNVVYKGLDEKSLAANKKWYTSFTTKLKNLGAKIVLTRKDGSKGTNQVSIGDAKLKIIWDYTGCDLKTSDYKADGLGGIDNHYKNDTSLVTMITYKNRKILMAGDIEERIEKLIIQSKIDIKADIFKLSHHGGLSSNIYDFIDKIDPIYAYMPNNFTKGNNTIMWQGDRKVNFERVFNGVTYNDNKSFKSFAGFVNSLGSQTNLYSTLYNGNTLFNISPSGEITVDTTRNYHILTVKYIDVDTKKEIQDSISYKFNNCSVYHLEKLDYDKKIEGYIFLNSNYEKDQTLSTDKTIKCNYQKKKINVEYSTTESTNKDVQVTLNSNTELQALDGWTLSKDKKKLTKKYSKNTNEVIKVKDTEKYEIITNVVISNIDKTAPKGTVTYSETNPTNKSITVTIKANEKIQNVASWAISSDGKVLTKKYDNNVEEKIVIKDLAGNQSSINIKIDNIIDQNMGDLNDNGQLDSGDIMKIYRHLAQANSVETGTKHPEWKLSDEKIIQGDLNKNGQIDMGDAIKIQRYMAANNNPDVAKKHPEWLIIQ